MGFSDIRTGARVIDIPALLWHRYVGLADVAVFRATRVLFCDSTLDGEISVWYPVGPFLSLWRHRLADDIKWLKLIVHFGRLIGMMPKVSFFTDQQLTDSLLQCGLLIEECWKPGKRKAVFMEARKPVPNVH